MLDEDVKFKSWMNKVDQILIGKCGMSHRDLGDIDYRDLFDAGESPLIAAIEALEENGGGDLV